MYHTIEKGRRLILQADTHADAARHLGTFAEQPFFTNRLFVALAEHELIRFLLDEIRHAILVDKTYGDDIIALAEQSLRHLIATRRILIARIANQLSINIGIVAIIERTQEQLCLLACMLCVNMDMLAQPQRANPFALGRETILIDLRPVLVVKG